MNTSSVPTERRRCIESSSLYTNKDDNDPFSSMKIDNASFLEDTCGRGSCPKCNKSRKYYCYNCYVAIAEISHRLPLLCLPVKIDIIKHPKEVDGKSTSAHAAVLAPSDVKVYTYPDIPCYDNEEVLLIFPSKSAIPLQEWWHKKLQSHNKPDESFDNKMKLPFSKAVFIDSTWRQTKALYNDPRLKKLPSILLTSHRSLFWRYYEGKHETHLSTIEAVYYFLQELHSLIHPEEPYYGQYDNILFFFKFMYFKIRTFYDPKKLKAYRQSADVR